MKEIKMPCGEVVIVSDCDYEFLSKIKWHIHKSKVCSYVRSGCGKYRMHNLIMMPEEGKVVDHIDGDGLNNTRENLRICERWQNNGNVRKTTKPTSSKYKGVYYSKSINRWCADIYVNNKKVRLGKYKTENEAGEAYNKAALERWGEFAKLNIIE